MESIERTLESFTWAKPPEWLKAEALLAAQNETIRQRTRRRLQAVLVAAIAAGLLLAAVGHFVANIIAPFRDDRPVLIQAGPATALPAGIEFIDADERPGHARPVIETLPEPADTESATPAETGAGGK